MTGAGLGDSPRGAAGGGPKRTALNCSWRRNGPPAHLKMPVSAILLNVATTLKEEEGEEQEEELGSASESRDEVAVASATPTPGGLFLLDGATVGPTRGPAITKWIAAVAKVPGRMVPGGGGEGPHQASPDLRLLLLLLSLNLPVKMEEEEQEEEGC